ncbi:hypothetical protein KAT80_02300 [Candidatus Pacearchaeota archaeon]|nr:hypothetical protein [Candidatus Pacearchaeota archaeon]
MASDEESIIIADEKQSARAKSKDGLLEIQLFNGGLLEVESPGTVSIQVERIGPDYKLSPPEGAVYRIITYISRTEVKSILPGAIYINSKGEYLLPGGENLNKRARRD